MTYAWGPPGPSWQLGLRGESGQGGGVQLYAAVRRTGTEETLAAGTLTLQTRDSGGAVTEDGNGPRPTTDLPLTGEVTEIAGWRLPAAAGAGYRATFTGPDGAATLVSGWVGAAED
jgi:hypothetical protein